MKFPEPDEAMLRRMLAVRQPALADEPLWAVSSAGTDNALFRVGDALVARLPCAAWATEQPAREHRWLPVLAPALPMAIPEPVALCEPADAWPCQWALHRWLPGVNGLEARFADGVREARRLGAFLRALRGVDASAGPPAGPGNNGRGAALAVRDLQVRGSIAEAATEIDGDAALAAWEADAAHAPWKGAPVWVHGDVHAGNLLLRDGAISAVIDFGTLGVGDPAVDLLPAWNLFEGEARAAFRAAVGLDEDSWARGRAWALSVALIALPYYLGSNPEIVEQSRRVIAAVLADHAEG